MIRIEFDSLESTWERAGEEVLVTDADGGCSWQATRRSNTGRLLVRPRSTRKPIRPPASYPDNSRKPPDLTILERRGPHDIVELNAHGRAEPHLRIKMHLPDYGWTIHRFTDLSVVDADRRDGTIIGAAVSGMAILLLVYLVQRQRPIVLQKRQARCCEARWPNGPAS